MKELKNELCRCMGALATVEPGTEEHTRLVADVDRIMRLLWDHAGADGKLTKDIIPEVNVGHEMPSETNGNFVPKSISYHDPVGYPGPVGVPVLVDEPSGAEPPAPEPVLTKAEVKAKLLTLSNKYDALDLSAVMGGMGYTKLSDVPGERYTELLTRAENAVKELVS